MKTKLFTEGALIAVVTYSEVLSYAIIKYYFGLDQIPVNEHEHGETYYTYEDFISKVEFFAKSKGLTIKK